MTKDYAKRKRFDNHKRISFNLQNFKNIIINDQKKRILVIGLIATIGLLGLMMAARYYWQSKSTVQNIFISTTPKNTPSTVATVPEQESPRFDFYTLLPNMTIELPEQEKASSPTYKLSAPSIQEPTKQQYSSQTAQPSKTLKKTEHSSFIVQAGSFRHATQADELKAMLTLNGFEANIQTIKIQDGEIWFRVFLGPFESKEEALNTQLRLKTAQTINSLILKIQV